VVSAALVAMVAALIGLVPVPYRSRAEGVIWIPDESFVRAGTEGFIQRVKVEASARVRKGEVLILLDDPVLSANIRELEARLRELEARYAAQQPADRVKADIIREEMAYTRQSLVRARERAADLTIRSRTDGTFVLPAAEDLPGRFVRRGELVGHVVELGMLTVRAVVPQAAIDLVRQRTLGVEVRLAENVSEAMPAAVDRIVPAASERLPAPALGSGGGGRIATDPTDRAGVTATQKVFQVDVKLPSHAHVLNVGGRAYLRFDHGRAPLGVQWYQQLRQLFLSRFNV
jgi:putative peptide zinc metalloprotease protein